MNNNNNRKRVAQHLKPLCNDPKLWNEFMQYIDICVQSEYNALSQAADNISIYRSQGKIAALKNLLHLREEANG